MCGVVIIDRIKCKVRKIVLNTYIIQIRLEFYKKKKMFISLTSILSNYLLNTIKYIK